MTAEEFDRWEPRIREDGTWSHMKIASNGQWVRYEDAITAARELAEAKREIAVLHAEIEQNGQLMADTNKLILRLKDERDTAMAHVQAETEIRESASVRSLYRRNMTS